MKNSGQANMSHTVKTNMWHTDRQIMWHVDVYLVVAWLLLGVAFVHVAEGWKHQM